MGAETILGFFPLAVLPAALAGALMAFLLWNFYPARLLPGAVGCLFLAGAVGGIPLSIGRGDLALVLGLPFWAEGLAALLQGVWRRFRGRPLFKAGSLDAWLRKKGGPVSAFYVFCALALAGVLAALRTRAAVRRCCYGDSKAPRRPQRAGGDPSARPRPLDPAAHISWLATLALIVIFGLVMLFSASYTTGYLRMGDSFHYIKSQALYALIGVGVMFLFSYFDLRFIRKFVWAGYLVSLVLLVAVLFCEPLNGCRRWLNIRGLPTLQVSELVKFEMILLTAHLASRTRRPIPREGGAHLGAGGWLYQKLIRELAIPLAPLVPVVLLLVLEPHMSGIVLMCAIVGSILLLNRQRRHHHLRRRGQRGVSAGDAAVPHRLHPLPAGPAGRLDQRHEQDDRPDPAEPVRHRFGRG